MSNRIFRLMLSKPKTLRSHGENKPLDLKGTPKRRNPCRRSLRMLFSARHCAGGFNSIAETPKTPVNMTPMNAESEGSTFGGF